MLHVLALIPARSGSKGIAHKNIAPFLGKPLLAHSIAYAESSSFVSRIIVSTDSELYAQIAREYGADVPFLRPPQYAGDLSPDIDVFRHALHWLSSHENYVPELCVHLRPTYPVRPKGALDEAIEMLVRDATADSVRSVAPLEATPFKMWFLREGELVPCTSGGPPEAWNLPRQALPKAFIQNACIDVVRSKVILEKNSMTGTRILGLRMLENLDIDTPEEFQRAARGRLPRPQGCRIVIDIDGILATLTPANDYAQAAPIMRNISVVNQLAAHGNEIILFTARGSATGADWRALTRSQLQQWGVRYSELVFGKPHGDYYIDDRSVNLEELAIALDLKDKASTS